MKTMKKLCLALTLIGFSFAASADILIVVNKNNPINNISSNELAKIFLGKAQEFKNGNTATPVNQSSGQATNVTFSTKYLKRNETQLKAYWQKMMFSGAATPPKELTDDASVLNFVSSNPGAIGYINGESLNDSVKTVVID